MSQDESPKQKFPIVYMAIMLMALILVIVAMISLKSCAAKLETEANDNENAALSPKVRNSLSAALTTQ